MAKNVGTADKAVRFVLILVIIILYATKIISGLAAIILGIVALALLVTSILSYCPLYTVLKVSTLKKGKAEKVEKPETPAKP